MGSSRTRSEVPVPSHRLVTRVRTQVSISGFTEREARDGLDDLRAELAQRPWLLDPSVAWDNGRQCLVVAVTNESASKKFFSRTTAAAEDEIWDCVIACLDFSTDGITFTVDSSSVVAEG